MKQCKACPWKVATNPDKDIPRGYSKEKHEALKKTIAEPGAIYMGPLHIMACHDTNVGEEKPCVGWLVNQLGPGNNIGLRLRSIDGRYDNLETFGEQHETLEDTIK